MLYLYTVINTFVSFFLIGIFYGSFSIFVRSIFSSQCGLQPTQTANLLENIYIVFLFYCLIISTSVKIEWAETYFKVGSGIMGVFSIFMIISMLFYIQENSIVALSNLFILILAGLFIVPLLLNIRKVKPVEALKGICSVIFMTPTYLTLMSIYAIANTHDVSWGSRPAGSSNQTVSEKEKKMKDDYKNFRSWELIIWIMCNIGCGFVVVKISRDGETLYLTLIGGFLISVVGAKFLLSLIHSVYAVWKNILYKRYIKLL